MLGLFRCSLIVCYVLHLWVEVRMHARACVHISMTMHTHAYACAHMVNPETQIFLFLVYIQLL